MKLAGEEVHAEVAVLAGLGRDGDADDLARAALEDQQITNADEVAGDGDRLGRVSTTGLHNSDGLADTIANAGWAALVADGALFLPVVVVMEGVENTVSRTLNATAERVVLTFVVVVTHFAR